MALPTSGLTGHYDASDSSTLFTTFVSGGPHTGTPTDGATVAVWKNTAVSNSILRQVGANGLPVYRSATPLLPRACLDFTGGQRLGTTTDTASALPLSTFVTAAAHTLFVAFYPETLTTGFAQPVYNQNLLVGETGGYFAVSAAALSVSDAAPYQVSGFLYDSGDKHVSLPLTLATPAVVMVRHEAGALSVALNGGVESSVAAGNIGSLTGQVTVGFGYVSSVAFDGRIGEIALYNVALTGTALADATAYFTGRWLAAAPAALASASAYVWMPA